MLWRYTWLFGIAVVIASFVVSLTHVSVYWLRKEVDGCSMSALMNTEIAKPRCVLYTANRQNAVVAEAKQTSDVVYRYTRREVKEDTSYTVLPGLRFIRGPTQEATRKPEMDPRIQRDGDGQSVVRASVETTTQTVVKPNVEVMTEPVVSSVKPQPPSTPTRKYSSRSTHLKRATWKETKRADRSLPSIPSSVKRPNVTMHEKYGTEAFRKEANQHILDMESRGACSPENCRAFVGSRRVDFDSSTDCSSRQSLSS